MKTKEEIVIFYSWDESGKGDRILYEKDAKLAMQEYADQETAAKDKIIADLTRKLAECERKNPT